MRALIEYVYYIHIEIIFVATTIFMTKEILSCCVDRLKIICEFSFDKDLFDIFCQTQVVKKILILNDY